MTRLLREEPSDKIPMLGHKTADKQFINKLELRLRENVLFNKIKCLPHRSRSVPPASYRGLAKLSCYWH